MVYIAPKPTSNEQLYDDALKASIAEAKRVMIRENDDCVCFFAGDVGTGKSTLAQHIKGIYTGDASYDADATTFSLEEYAQRLVTISTQAHEKILRGEKAIGGYIFGDEFDYRSIENQTKKNRGLDAIFNVVRLHQHFQGLNWPQLEKLPQSFVADRVKMIFVLNSKDERNRTYILYTKNEIRRMIADKIGDLNMTTLTRRAVVNKYASIVGWFRPNNNIENPDYVKRKSEAILKRITEWNDTVQNKDAASDAPSEGQRGPKPKHPQIMLNISQAMSTLNIKDRTKFVAELLRMAKLGKIDYARVYQRRRWQFTPEILDIIAKEEGMVRISG